jgi:hypothetical protein
MLTKSDFTTYLDAPMHLWAERNNRLETAGRTPYQKYLMDQGYEVEKLAKVFIQEVVARHYARPEIFFQKTFTDRHYLARVDAAIYDPQAETWDIFEIKSSTSVRKDHKYDLAFQRLVCKASITVRDVYLLHINKNYVRDGELEISELFVAENITADVDDLLDVVQGTREDALWVVNTPSPGGIMNCLKPKYCPCPTLCHPGMPEYSIYDLTRLGKRKAADLMSRGVISITDVPGNYPLSDKQKHQVLAAKAGAPILDRNAIRDELARLRYPLYFLDYETHNPGIPLHNGYQPYQHMVFQYSLHLVTEPGGEPRHNEYLSTCCDDPVPGLLAHLAEHIGDSGSVIVWNQAFEASRNVEMAARNGSYAGLLRGINERMYDLMEIFRIGYYVHPDFHGSYSIKSVLPVLAPDFDQSYADLPISKGDDAMVAWLEITSGKLSPGEIQTQKDALLRYCELDTLALVEIWRVLNGLVNNVEKGAKTKG